ncbi:hypothetical protein V4F39_00730 [Aquincola sp. MAHUQ-54]|uniref:Uncharacterized protein n=1 Tax=Aquincola agrisoli TaxID=3119538 RepID=A0AAW9Q6W5_9BURK
MAWTARQRWIAYAGAGALTAAAIVTAPPPAPPVDDTLVAAVPATAPAARGAGTAAPAPAPRGGLVLPDAARRAFAPSAADPFAMPAWEAPPPPPASVAPAPVAEVAPPSAPPLPFTYLGKWIEQGQTTVFLSAGGRDHSARVGATLEGGYRVEAIEEHQIVLRYQPLGTLQALPLQAQPGSTRDDVEYAPDTASGETENN